MRSFLFILSTVCMLAFSTACRKGADVEPYPTDPLGRVNRWVLDSMRQYYYWVDDIPSGYDYAQPTEIFFKNLLSPHDRFSWISNGQDIPAPSNSYFMYGFHYALAEVPGYNGLIGVITLVNPSGAADRAGLKRGDYFTGVNGATITAATIETVKLQLKTGPQLTLVPAKWDNNTWTALPEIHLSVGFAAENPVHFTRTLSAGGITTGYLFYNSFDEHYDPQLLQAIIKLKQAGVSELVLDLRYNAGGSVATSAKLAALLAGNLTGGETYVIYQGNRHEGRKVRSLQAVLNTSGNSAGKQYADLQPNCLHLRRVFILATGATVSAAELIINNLGPFIPVIQIGETTAGKDEASFLIEDFRVPKEVNWKMQPTIYKLFNKHNQGAYHNGLAPAYPIPEIAQLPLHPIGEPGDPLLQKALQMIYGDNVPWGFVNLRAQVRGIPAKAVYHSAKEQALSPPVLIPVAGRQ